MAKKTKYDGNNNKRISSDSNPNRDEKKQSEDTEALKGKDNGSGINCFGKITELAISVLLIAFVSLFGFIEIKGATDDIGLRDKGFRNLSQVYVYADVFDGRGIILSVTDEYIDILTSRHLVERENKVSVEFGNGSKCDSEVYYYYEDYDAAIIRVFREDSDKYLKAARAVNVCSRDDYESMRMSRRVYYASDLYDTSSEYVEGIWVEGDRFVYEFGTEVGIFSGEVLPGMSGEGLFDEDDNLVGMIIAATDTEGAVIPAYKLRNEYMKWILSNKGEQNENN